MTENQDSKYKYDLASAAAGADLRPRHAIIGGIAGLVTSGVIVIGSAIGYHNGNVKTLTPFETARDRGIVVQRNDGTKIPYTFDKDGNLTLVEIRKL